MRYFTKVVFAVLIFLSPIGPANAAVIIVQDLGDCFAPNPDGCQLDGGLTVLDPIFSFSTSGVGLGQTFPITIVAPAEFQLYVSLTTGVDGIGFYFDDAYVPAGSSYTLFVDGNSFVPGPKFTTITVLPEDYLALAALPGGFLPLGPSVSTVPIPAAAWLFGWALMGLVAIGRKKRLLLVR